MKKQEKQHSKLKIIPLGGLEQIGMNSQEGMRVVAVRVLQN